MSIVNTLALESNRQIKINFDGGDLSSDAGLLLIKEFISKLGIDTLLEKAFKTAEDCSKVVHSARYITFKRCSSCPYKNEFYETLSNIGKLNVRWNSNY